MKNGFALRVCARCRSVFTGELPKRDLAADYDHYYHAANLEVASLVHRRLDELVAALEPYRLENRWLDVGCGAGALVEAAARAGWRVQGTEVAPQPVDRLRSRGFDVLRGRVQDLQLPEAAYDVVTLLEVLEHVSDPRALIASAAGLLRPGGVLYLTTPHARGVSARVLGLGWSVVGPPEHLQLLSVGGVRAMANASGLVEESVQTHAVNPHELLGALRRRRGAAGGTERVQSSCALNEALHRRRSGVWLKQVVNALLDATRLGDALKYRAARPT